VENQFYERFSQSLRAQQQGQLLLVGMGVLFFLSSVVLLVSVVRSSRSAFELQQTQVATLEEAVSSRTRALELAAAVSRRISSINQIGSLAVEVVEDLKQAFDYYHAHIYLLDESGQTLVMTGGTGEVGQTLLESGHSLPLGKGLVGRAALNGETILVSDTTSDPAWLPNPLLPDTRAEIAVPIKAAGRVLGVLDVQNNQTNSLTNQDTLLIETIADQVGVALENIRANQSAQLLLNDYQQLVETAPAAIALLDAETGAFVQANPQMQSLFGFSADDLGKLGPVDFSPERQPDGRASREASQAYTQQALEKGYLVFGWTHRSLSGREFQAEIRLTPAPSRMGHPMLNAIITDITERYQQEEQTRKSAQRQEILNQVTQRIQSTATVEEALQVAARELGHALGAKPTLVELQPPASISAPPSQS